MLRNVSLPSSLYFISSNVPFNAILYEYSFFAVSIYPQSCELSPVGPREYSLSILAVIPPVALISAPIVESKDSLAFLHIVYELPNIHAFIRVVAGTVTGAFPIDPVAIVLVLLIWPCINSRSMLHISFPIAIIVRAVGPFHFSSSVTFVVPPVAIVRTLAILLLVDHYTVAVLLIQIPCPFVA